MDTNSNSISSNHSKPIDLGKKLLNACRDGRIDTVRQLVHSGAPFATDWLGTTPLHLAVNNGHCDIVELLLGVSCNIDARTKVDRTALHLAAQKGFTKIAKLLIWHGANVNVQDMLRMTPLHWAVEERNASLINLLLQNGANIDIKNKFFLSPVELAIERQYLDVFDLFVQWRHQKSMQVSIQKVADLVANSNLKSTPSSISNSNICSVSSHNSSSSSSSSSVSTSQQLSKAAFSKRITNPICYQDVTTPTLQHKTKSQQSSQTLDFNDSSCNEKPDLDMIKLEPDLFLQLQEDDKSVEYWMKIVDDLQKENSKLRQKLGHLSGP